MTRTVEIRDFDRSVSGHMLQRLFEQHGCVKRVTLPKRGEKKRALVEFSSNREAAAAIDALDGTAPHRAGGSYKELKKINPEFVWSLNLLSEDHLWEEDPRDTTRVEKEIVSEKKKNMRYVESLGKEISVEKSLHQRKPLVYVRTGRSPPETAASKERGAERRL